MGLEIGRRIEQGFTLVAEGLLTAADALFPAVEIPKQYCSEPEDFWDGADDLWPGAVEGEDAFLASLRPGAGVEYGLGLPNGEIIWGPALYRGHGLDTAPQRARLLAVLRATAADLDFQETDFLAKYRWHRRVILDQGCLSMTDPRAYDQEPDHPREDLPQTPADSADGDAGDLCRRSLDGSASGHS